MRQFNSELLDKPWFNDREMWPAVSDDAGDASLQPLSPRLRARLRRPAAGDRLLPACSSIRSCSTCPATTCAPRICRTRSAIATWRRCASSASRRWRAAWTSSWASGCMATVAHQPAGANYTIEGITAENHAAYCRDALTAVLRACPAISRRGAAHPRRERHRGGQLRFLEDGLRRREARAGARSRSTCTPRASTQTMIDNALATGMPVNLSPKYWAEHLGMPYHQAAIRELEMPVAGRSGAG